MKEKQEGEEVGKKRRSRMEKQKECRREAKQEERKAVGAGKAGVGRRIRREEGAGAGEQEGEA